VLFALERPLLELLPAVAPNLGSSRAGMATRVLRWRSGWAPALCSGSPLSTHSTKS
jgi:hypothetical protein